MKIYASIVKNFNTKLVIDIRRKIIVISSGRLPLYQKTRMPNYSRDEVARLYISCQTN